MSLPDLSTSQLLAIPLCTWIIWAALRHVIRRNPFVKVPGPEGKSLLFGHLPKLFDPKEGLKYHESLVREYDQVAKIGGLFGRDMLLVSDPKALHHILVKDQDVVWEEGRDFLISNGVVFGPGVLSVLGQQHKKQRKMMNSVFSASHIRNMAPTFDELTTKLADTLSNIAGQDGKEVEVFEWLTRCALEIIGQGGFGYSFDDLSEHGQPHPFATSVKVLFPLIIATFPGRLLLLPFIRKYNIGGRAFQRWFMENLSWGAYKKLTAVASIMHQTSLEIFESGKRSLESENNRQDVLTTLMRANMVSDAQNKMSDDEVIAQISTFTFAGMDTSSSAAVRLLWLLSEHQHVQDKLRAEIRAAKEQYGQLSYDEIMGLPYLDAVCRETLRLYPPGPIAGRSAIKDTVIPLLRPIRGTDGKEIDEIFVPAGTDVLISIMGTNRNLKLWGPTANEWVPERWLDELPKALIDAKVPGVYSHMMTFAGGGRSCIGLKFAQLELKFMILNLLDRLKFSPSDKKIWWKAGGIVGPSTDLDKLRPELPIVIQRAL